MDTFAQRLTEARTRSGMSLRDLQSKTGIDASNISRLEHGRRKSPSLEVALRLSEALNVELGWLAGQLDSARGAVKV